MLFTEVHSIIDSKVNRRVLEASSSHPSLAHSLIVVISAATYQFLIKCSGERAHLLLVFFIFESKFTQKSMSMMMVCLI